MEQRNEVLNGSARNAHSTFIMHPTAENKESDEDSDCQIISDYFTSSCNVQNNSTSILETPSENLGQPFIKQRPIEMKSLQLVPTNSNFNGKMSTPFHCYCVDESTKGGDNEQGIVACQALNSVDGKPLRCRQPVFHASAVQVSRRMPNIIMCDMHLWKLRCHLSCPQCGTFCAQGTFMQCTGFDNSNKVRHLFHKHCVLNINEQMPKCLHCGSNSNVQTVKLNLKLTSSPACLIYADHFTANNVISMMSSSESLSQNTNAVVKLKSGLILDASGLPSITDQRDLEATLIKFKSTKERNIPSYPLRELYMAAVEGHHLKVLFMLFKGASPNTKFMPYNSETALHGAAKAGNVIGAHILLQAGCVIDIKNDNFQTPIMEAVENEKVKMVEYLIYRDVNSNHVNNSNSTCLQIAVMKDNFNMCSILLSSSTLNIDSQDETGSTALILASKRGHFDIVELLLERGANPNFRDNKGNTALHWAAIIGNPKLCKLFYKFQCNMNETNLCGDTAMHIAAKQDNSAVIDYLLVVNTYCDIKNNDDLRPLDCCPPDSASSEAIKLELMSRTLERETKGVERMISPDISLGAEKIPIQCVNWFNDKDLSEVDFLYVMDNCETGSTKIDRSIASLNHCNCYGDCFSASCKCAHANSHCWYNENGLLLPDFDTANLTTVFECNRACMCDPTVCKNRIVQKGITCRLQLFQTATKGWGVRTLESIPKGKFICEYLGELVSDFEANKKDDDTYLFDLDHHNGETYCIDARYFGNISRFINHLCDANLMTLKVFIDEQDRNFPRIAFFSCRDIAPYEELGFDYGIKFWSIKSKMFTCNCGSTVCKYSSKTIKKTLASWPKPKSRGRRRR